MKKAVRHHIYFTEADIRILNKLAEKRNESKSAMVRKLINIEKYANTLKQIELNNEILSEFLKEFSHIGANLNQIAFHLNADITKDSEAKSDFEKTMREFKAMGNKFYKQLESLKLNLNVKHTKTPSNEKIKGEENE